MILAAHEPFESLEAAIKTGSDIHSDQRVVQRVTKRIRVGDTDIGHELSGQIQDLQKLIAAYRSGKIAEKQ